MTSLCRINNLIALNDRLLLRAEPLNPGGPAPKKPIFGTGNGLDTANYLNVANAAAGDSFDLVLTRGGNMLDRIQMIVVGGGYPEYYVEYIKIKFSHVLVIDFVLGAFGNVSGFLLSGKETIRGRGLR